MPYQLGYHKARLVPLMGKNAITWKCTDINGNTVTYKYRNRLDVKD
jgi:adenylylsulfate reductase subunit B